jgi:hypothetical protein
MFEPGEIDFEQARFYGDGLLVFGRCEKCGRYLRVAADSRVIVNGLGDVVDFRGFSCSLCGSVRPFWIYAE